MELRIAEASAGSILRTTDAKTLELIDLYQREECLWNSHIEDYKNKAMRAQAADKIATILNIPNFTAKHVLMKFKNLRNSYAQEQKKIALSLALGATGEHVYAPKVFWYSKLDAFIKPHLQVRDKQQQKETLIYKSGEAEEWVIVSDAEPPLNPNVIMVDSPSSSEEDRSNDSCKKRKRKSKSALKEQKSVSRTLNDIQSDLHVLMSHNDDHYDTFGKYVASLLRSLPSQKASALEPKILTLISTAMNDGSQPQVEVDRTLDDTIVVKIERDE